MLYNESKHNILAFGSQGQQKTKKTNEKLAAEQHTGLHCQASDTARLGVISISQILEAKSHQKISH
jgi:hypothetical protein